MRFDTLKKETQLHDCFGVLPLEIRLEIAYLLPTLDYLSLRLASKAMVHIFGFQAFWKTRFFVHRERGYLNYLLVGGCKDWRLMYRCTSRMGRLPKTLRFRRLHWLHNEWIKDRCMMNAAPLATSSENNLPLDDLLWDRAAGTVQCDRLCESYGRPPLARELENCGRCLRAHRLLPRQITVNSGELLEIAVSVLAEHEHSFITGFHLSYGGNMRSIDFGYQIPGKQIKIDLRGRQMTGFEVFAGEGGIQAIRPVFDQKYEIRHSLIGKPNTTCQPVLLTPDGEIKAFAGDFDVSRIF